MYRNNMLTENTKTQTQVISQKRQYNLTLLMKINFEPLLKD